ncbi:MAG TPA: zinc-dependent alcohol dehydrogenase family protein [Pirellulales bacterium]|jgi:alcohol dehydrogenase|nr:zinc-dependent alcohol dehydrogenase family protein [Pirellulales bacterium]
MKTKAAVLYRMGELAPFAHSKPLVIEEIEVSGPHEGEVLVEVTAAGLCHSDLSVIDGSRPRVMPMVLGHEAAGIVREVGSGVRSLAEGDHVVFSFVPVCGRCQMCICGRAALCENGAKANLAGTLLSGARRFKDAAGNELNHHLGVSAFSQFTVVAAESLVRIDPAIPLDKAALVGCAVMTGVGAVVNTAKVETGAAVAIFGLGGVGLSAVLGARAIGANPIVAIDLLEPKLELARQLGATQVVNSADADALDQIRAATNGGAHYAIECVGNPAAMAQAYAATRRGGTTISVGLPGPTLTFPFAPLSLVAEERTIKGSFMGSCVPQRDIPRFIAMYQAGLLPIEQLHTHSISLEEINAGMDVLAAGQTVRQMICFR